MIYRGRIAGNRSQSAEPRILFIAPSAYPLGGVAVWLDYLSRGLRDLGWEVTVALASGEYHDITAYRVVYPTLPNVVEICNPTGSQQGRINSLIECIEDVNPTIVVGINIPDAYEAVNRLREKRKARVRVVMAMHGFEQDMLSDARRYRDVLDGVVGTNRLTLRLLEQVSRLGSEQLLYAPYGVKLLPNCSIRELEAPFHILWSGRLESSQKRIMDIPAILENLAEKGNDYEFSIAGSGPEEEELRAKLAGKGLLGRVRFLGTVDHRKMGKVYRDHDALLITSFWETGPIVAWEAMATGTPIVTSRYLGSGAEGALKDATNCLMFETGNVVEAAKQLTRITDTVLASKIARGGRELIRKRYTRKISVDKWSGAFSMIMRRPPRVAALIDPIKNNGRLDHLLGTKWGEVVRKKLGVSFRHQGAGGEWPHSYGALPGNASKFWTLASKLDEYVCMENDYHAVDKNLTDNSLRNCELS